MRKGERKKGGQEKRVKKRGKSQGGEENKKGEEKGKREIEITKRERG